LDCESFERLKPLHGLIFLFKYVDHEPSGQIVRDSRVEQIFFAKQVIQNACATQAIVNLLLNSQHPDVHLGNLLTEFKDFTQGFSSADKGLCLSNSEKIRKVHNSFSRQQVFELDLKIPEKEDAYHYVAYVPINGRVYELDGLLDGPIDLGKIGDGQDWLDVIRPAIEQRMQKYTEGEIHFNLMALISDRRQTYGKRLEELAESGLDTEEVAEEIYHLQSMIEEEEQKALKFKEENVRRKHNYLPLIVELLKILANDGRLVPLIKQAKVKAEQESLKKDKEKKLAKSDANAAAASIKK